MPSTESMLVVSGDLDPTRTETELLLPDGRLVRVPTSLLLTPGTRQSAAAPEAGLDSQISVVPLVGEKLLVGRRTVETGRVLLQKTVQEFDTTLDEPLAVRTFDIERVVLNQPVDAAPAIRHEGDTTIYPLVEEQLILTRQLILKEEVRVTRRDTERRDTRTVTLRREHLEVERQPIPAGHDGDGAGTAPPGRFPPQS